MDGSHGGAHVREAALRFVRVALISAEQCFSALPDVPSIRKAVAYTYAISCLRFVQRHYGIQNWRIARSLLRRVIDEEKLKLLRNVVGQLGSDRSADGRSNVASYDSNRAPEDREDLQFARLLAAWVRVNPMCAQLVSTQTANAALEAVGLQPLPASTSSAWNMAGPPHSTSFLNQSISKHSPIHDRYGHGVPPPEPLGASSRPQITFTDILTRVMKASVKAGKNLTAVTHAAKKSRSKEDVQDKYIEAYERANVGIAQPFIDIFDSYCKGTGTLNFERLANLLADVKYGNVSSMSKGWGGVMDLDWQKDTHKYTDVLVNADELLNRCCGGVVHRYNAHVLFNHLNDKRFEQTPFHGRSNQSWRTDAEDIKDDETEYQSSRRSSNPWADSFHRTKSEVEEFDKTAESMNSGLRGSRGRLTSTRTPAENAQRSQLISSRGSQHQHQESERSHRPPQTLKQMVVACMHRELLQSESRAMAVNGVVEALRPVAADRLLSDEERIFLITVMLEEFVETASITRNDLEQDAPSPPRSAMKGGTFVFPQTPKLSEFHVKVVENLAARYIRVVVDGLLTLPTVPEGRQPSKSTYESRREQRLHVNVPQPSLDLKDDQLLQFNERGNHQHQHQHQESQRVTTPESSRPVVISRYGSPWRAVAGELALPTRLSTSHPRSEIRERVRSAPKSGTYSSARGFRASSTAYSDRSISEGWDNAATRGRSESTASGLSNQVVSTRSEDVPFNGRRNSWATQSGGESRRMNSSVTPTRQIKSQRYVSGHIGSMNNRNANGEFPRSTGTTPLRTSALGGDLERRRPARVARVAAPRDDESPLWQRRAAEVPPSLNPSGVVNESPQSNSAAAGATARSSPTRPLLSSVVYCSAKTSLPIPPRVPINAIPPSQGSPQSPLGLVVDLQEPSFSSAVDRQRQTGNYTGGGGGGGGGPLDDDEECIITGHVRAAFPVTLRCWLCCEHQQDGGNTTTTNNNSIHSTEKQKKYLNEPNRTPSPYRSRYGEGGRGKMMMTPAQPSAASLVTLPLDRWYASHRITVFQVTQQTFLLVMRSSVLFEGFVYRLIVETTCTSTGQTIVVQRVFAVPPRKGGLQATSDRNLSTDYQRAMFGDDAAADQRDKQSPARGTSQWPSDILKSVNDRYLASRNGTGHLYPMPAPQPQRRSPSAVLSMHDHALQKSHALSSRTLSSFRASSEATSGPFVSQPSTYRTHERQQNQPPLSARSTGSAYSGAFSNSFAGNALLSAGHPLVSPLPLERIGLYPY